MPTQVPEREGKRHGPAAPVAVGRRTIACAAILRGAWLLGCVLLGLSRAEGSPAPTASDMALTKHNLAVSGPGPIRAETETRICVFCHTPHNATPLSPLWNKAIQPRVYSVYTSPTQRTGPLPQPSGATKLCLSCHDGTIAMGAVVNPATGIAMAGSGVLPAGSLSDFGLDLSGHHPVSFPYHSALPNPDLAPSPPPDLVYGGVDEVHCTTCHDPHIDANGSFLLKDNRYSALCTMCHQMSGWVGSAHATSTAPVSGVLPRPPRTSPNWSRMNEWGCEVCHTPHFAPTAEQLLNFTASPPDPFSCTSSGCHSSDPAPPHVLAAGDAEAQAGGGGPAGIGQADIAGQILKISAHHERPGMITPALRAATGTPTAGIRMVECDDCHNPHGANDVRAEPPYVPGPVAEVAGVDRNGAPVRAVTYEYEICLKCHGDYNVDVEYIRRYIPGANKRLEFATSNPSYHPVFGIGKSLNVPSIPSSFEPAMTAAQMIYCTACHADDNGVSRGPHGSSFPPILRDRYQTSDNTPESFDNYALCYRCHDRASILSNASFQRSATGKTASGGGHSGHLAAGAPCSACHDPHGVPDLPESGIGPGGSHRHLINFDRSIVLPAAGNLVPIYNATGTYSGSCTLVCHGVAHDNASYP